uniref:Uncharacterized protein n=1 Tax=Meloidogyne enterolobii TaxID=390850 RepID=A0A6V7VHJ1_MELEN|nr:unnamed protein product [Meloidogyne enterolobii]
MIFDKTFLLFLIFLFILWPSSNAMLKKSTESIKRSFSSESLSNLDCYGELRYTKDSKQLEEFKSDLTDLNNEISNKENIWISKVKNLLKHYKETVNVAINLKNKENNSREETKLAVKIKCKEEMNNNEIEVPKYKIKEIKEIMHEFDEELKTINNKMKECTYEYDRLKEEFTKYYDENKLNKYKILLLDINYYSKDYFEAIKKAKDLIGENKRFFFF